MDFITDDELDGYVVLIFFCVRKEKVLALKKSKRFWVREIFKKRAAYGLYNNLVHELRTGDREFYIK